MSNVADVIMAFDPGGTTGYVVHYLRKPDKSIAATSTFDYVGAWYGGQLGPHEHHVELWTLLTREKPDIIITEDFVVRDDANTNVSGLNLMSVHYIGVIELYCAMTDTPLFKYSSSLVLNIAWVQDSALKRLGVLREPVTPWRHQNDAARHLIYHVVGNMDRKDILTALRRRTTDASSG